MFSLSTRKVGTLLAAVAATATMALAAPADASVAGPGAAPDERVRCGATPADKDHSSYVTLNRNAVNMRTGPSTNCTSVGLANRGNKLDYHCWVGGSGTHSWTYLRNVTRGTKGWVRDDLLPGYGSSVHC